MTVTREQFETYTKEQLEDGYSDCYKSLYGIRPRGNISKEALIYFWLNYEHEFLAMEAHEARTLQAWGFTSWQEYYDDLEDRYQAEAEAYKIEREQKAEYHFAYLTRFHSLPTIEAWEDGRL